MAYYLPNIRPRFFDANGDPLAGGLFYSYVAGTTTPLSTFSDPAGTTPNTNPVVLDADGYAPIFLAGRAYKFVLKDANDVTLWEQDNITPGEEADSEGGGGGSSAAFVTHAITNNMAVADLAGETVDFSLYSAAVFECEIIRGSPVTVHSTFRLSVQKFDGTGRVLEGVSEAQEAHGVTFSLSLVGTVATLRAATSNGPGAGTIKLSRTLIPV